VIDERIVCQLPINSDSRIFLCSLAAGHLALHLARGCGPGTTGKYIEPIAAVNVRHRAGRSECVLLGTKRHGAERRKAHELREADTKTIVSRVDAAFPPMQATAHQHSPRLSAGWFTQTRDALSVMSQQHGTRNMRESKG